MIKKYELVDESGRKRLRALRNFSVQGRDVNVHDLGGYVYDEKTLSQEGNCWIFSGSLEYPGVRVMDEAIVDMGNDTAKVAPRMMACTIRGNSRLMGAISFESASVDVLQTPARFEQGGYTATVGMVPVKASDDSRIRIPASVFGGSVGKVAITSASYEARIVSIDSDGLVTSGGAWTAGGPAVVLTTASPYFLVEVRKTQSAAITPADVTAAGITLTSARGSSLDINNSSIVPAYNGVPAVSSIMQISSVGTGSLFNCSMRAECVYNQANSLLFESDATKTNFFLTLSGGVQLALRGFKLRNTNFYSRQSLPIVGPQGHVAFDVSDCPAFTYDLGTFPDVAEFLRNGKTSYFKNCNMPAGSAIIYYDPLVTVWDNIDFTKAMADLGKLFPGSATLLLVSSDKQGLYRVYSTASNTFGMLVEKFSSVYGWVRNVISGSYDSIIYQDCTLTGHIHIFGRNVFGGTLGGASKITNTTETAMEIKGSFRIEGNAQVTDTPLKGTGYIGGNAELKNGTVEGYIYMDGNAKYIPAVVANPAIIKHVIMTGNSQVLKQRGVSNNFVNLELSDNAVIDSVASTDRGLLKMSGNAYLYGNNVTVTPLVGGTLEMKDDAKQVGGTLTIHGDVTICGGYEQTSGSQTITGKRTIANVSEIAAVELPPTKITW